MPGGGRALGLQYVRGLPSHIFRVQDSIPRVRPVEVYIDDMGIR